MTEVRYGRYGGSDQDCAIGYIQEGAFRFAESLERLTGPTEIDILNAKIAALTEHNNFLEGCIVELALSLYE